MARSPTTTSCSASPARPRRTRSSAPTGGSPASSIPTRGTATPRPRPGSRRSPTPTRCCPTPRSAGATTRSGPTAWTAAARPTRSAGSAGHRRRVRGVLRRQPVRRRRRRGPSGPPRGADLEVVADLEFNEAVFGCEHAVTVRTAVACAACGATGRRRRHRAGHLLRVPGHRPGPAGAPVVDRADGDVVAVRPLRRLGPDHRQPLRRVPGRGPPVEERTYTVDIPAGVDTGSTLRLSGRGAVGPRGGAAGDLYVHLRVAPAPALRARRRRPGHHRPPALHAGHARRHARLRDARRAPRSSRSPGARRRAPRSASGAGACPTSSGAAGATC